MEIRPVSNKNIKEMITSLDNKAQDKNPSIFPLKQENTGSTFDNDFLFKHLYT